MPDSFLYSSSLFSPAYFYHVLITHCCTLPILLIPNNCTVFSLSRPQPTSTYKPVEKEHLEHLDNASVCSAQTVWSRQTENSREHGAW